MIRAENQSSKKSSSLSWLDRTARRALFSRLADLRGGELHVCDADGREHFGAASDLQTRIDVRSPRFFREAVLGGTLSIAESYIQGHWDCDNLPALFRLFIRNLAAADQLDGGLPKLSMALQRIMHWLRANTPVGSRKNIQAHYDLGNEFFRLWLDETWAYSSGIFPSPDASLRAASVEKFDRACRKLQLEPDDHLLEIGTGWGGLALHAAGEYGCRVTTTTISQEQFDVARNRVHAAGLEKRVSLLQQDYRHLTGCFNKLISIEMVEAVGHRYFDDYFRKCGELLTPDGFAVLRTPWPMVLQTPVASVSAGSRPVREATKKDKRSRVKKGRTWRRHGEAMDPKRAAEQLGEEEDEVEVPEGAPVAAAAAPVSEPVPADLHLPNAVGPETHTYKTMALHLYAKKPRE